MSARLKPRYAVLALLAALAAVTARTQIMLIPDSSGGGFQMIPRTTGATGGTGPTFLPVITGLGGTLTPRSNISLYAGESIFTNATFRVDHLGRPCLTGNSLSHALYLLNLAGTTTLGTVSVNMAGCTPGTFVWGAITPVTLAAGTFYVCFSGETNAGDAFYDDPLIPATGDAASVSQSAYSNNAPPATPPSGVNFNTANHAYVPCNVGYLPYSWMTAAPSGASLSNSNFYRGARITATATVTVNQVGRPCIAGNSQVHDIWLMDTTGATSLAHTTVNMSGCIAGTFEWAPVSATLNSGTSYLLLSGEAIGGDAWYNDSATFTVDTTLATIATSVIAGNGGPTTQPTGPYTSVTAGSMFVGITFGH